MKKAFPALLAVFGMTMVLDAIAGIVEFVRAGDWRFANLLFTRSAGFVLFLGIGYWLTAQSVKKWRSNEALWEGMDGPLALRISGVVVLLLLFSSAGSMVVLSVLGFDSAIAVPWVICVASLFAIPVLIAWYLGWRIKQHIGRPVR
ncbi:MAG TPA: hypothetical protein ENK19_04890 [Acidobacteria bacterium]|nr:hypothetical protein [Acidobacteriota bacterium]